MRADQLRRFQTKLSPILGAQDSSDLATDDGMLSEPDAGAIQLAFDATSAYAHADDSRKLIEPGVRVIDLTPAFLLFAQHAAAKYDLSSRDILVELGRRNTSAVKRT